MTNSAERQIKDNSPEKVTEVCSHFPDGLGQREHYVLPHSWKFMYLHFKARESRAGRGELKMRVEENRRPSHRKHLDQIGILEKSLWKTD